MACFAAPAQIVLTNFILFVIATAAERQTSDSTRNSVISGNSIYLSAFGSNDDYLDFSMPSYGSSESTSKPKADPPSFGNPFSDFDFKAPKAEESSWEDKTETFTNWTTICWSSNSDTGKNSPAFGRTATT